jgi:hypothetical protein
VLTDIKNLFFWLELNWVFTALGMTLFVEITSCQQAQLDGT